MPRILRTTCYSSIYSLIFSLPKSSSGVGDVYSIRDYDLSGREFLDLETSAPTRPLYKPSDGWVKRVMWRGLALTLILLTHTCYKEPVPSMGFESCMLCNLLRNESFGSKEPQDRGW